MQITVGHTPDADDALMFYGIESNNVTAGDLQVKHVVEDIESLNKRALKHELDVTAVSAHALAYVNDYVVLRSGGSFGRAYGPIVVAKKRMDIDELKRCRIAVPGKMTTAYLLLRMAIGEFDSIEMRFSEINGAVERGEVDVGLVIHEAQITYDQAKLVNTLDLGAWWDRNTNGLPLPLGINVAGRKLGTELITKFDDLLRRSIRFGLENLDAALDHAMWYARGTPRQTIERFAKMYVNDLTLDMGEQGARALEEMFAMAGQRKILGAVEVAIAGRP